MDFFKAQEEARRSTALLVVYFLTAVALIVLAVYLVAFAFLSEPRAPLWDPSLFTLAALGTGLLVGGGALHKIAQLADGGGAAVAEGLGGRRVARETEDPAERRLLNVVDEMAIASGVPVPPVYLLDGEAGINAFAAGESPTAAVVAVTRGTLERLSRDELQGVIAHEFSHLLNGDMRLNLRLIGVLHGILLLALLGRGLLRGGGRSRGNSGAGMAGVGLALVLIGYIGVFFGRLIKAAVSRQREYLADASAVQFTRNPAGIAGALKKIGGVDGSLLGHARAEEASHLYFGAGVDLLFGWFDTHPPIAERIRRLDPDFNPERLALGAESADGSPELQTAPQAFAAAAGRVTAPHVAYAQRFLDDLPAAVREALRRPETACRVVFGLLLAGDEAVAEAQLDQVRAAEGDEVGAAVAALRGPLATLGGRARLPLVDLALPALLQLEPAPRARFLETTRRLVRADRRLDLFEYALQHILARSLAPARAAGPRRAHGPRALRGDCALLLSALAGVGNRGEAAERAFHAGAALAPLDGPWERPPREALGLSQVDGALTRLAATPPRFKRRLVEACAATVLSDRQVTATEGELLRAVCEALEVPMPPLL